MQFFTPDQLIAWMDEQKCCKCNEKAKWIPVEKGFAYCDEHYPYKEETEESKLQMEIR